MAMIEPIAVAAEDAVAGEVGTSGVGKFFSKFPGLTDAAKRVSNGAFRNLGVANNLLKDEKAKNQNDTQGTAQSFSGRPNPDFPMVN
jgi:hypothetical protein